MPSESRWIDRTGLGISRCARRSLGAHTPTHARFGAPAVTRYIFPPHQGHRPDAEVLDATGVIVFGMQYGGEEVLAAVDGPSRKRLRHPRESTVARSGHRRLLDAQSPMLAVKRSHGMLRLAGSRSPVIRFEYVQDRPCRNSEVRRGPPSGIRHLPRGVAASLAA